MRELGKVASTEGEAVVVPEELCDDEGRRVWLFTEGELLVLGEWEALTEPLQLMELVREEKRLALTVTEAHRVPDDEKEREGEPEGEGVAVKVRVAQLVEV